MSAPAELIRQVRRLQLRAKRVVQSLLGGEYHSVFKGTGISFEDVREYQPGDDVRSIDWNVTARMKAPFVKRYVEERELTVLLLVDVGASRLFGSRRRTKRQSVAELASLIAFCAIANNDRVGLLAVSDQIERFVTPSKGTKHALRLLRDILFFEPQRRGTSLKTALDSLNRLVPKRAIVFLFSDFHDTGYEQSFRLAARKHDMITVCTRDPLEDELPNVGLLQLEDAESDTPILIDTSSSAFRDAYTAKAKAERLALRQLTKSTKSDLIEIASDGDHLESLVRFFQLREKRARRS